LREALQLLQEQRQEDALARLRELLTTQGLNAQLVASIGVTLGQAGDKEGALRALEQAHYLQPADPRILYNYGLALRNTGRAQEAVYRFQGVLALDPGYERALLQLLEIQEFTRGSAASAPPSEAPPAARANGAAVPTPNEGSSSRGIPEWETVPFWEEKAKETASPSPQADAHRQPTPDSSPGSPAADVEAPAPGEGQPEPTAEPITAHPTPREERRPRVSGDLRRSDGAPPIHEEPPTTPDLFTPPRFVHLVRGSLFLWVQQPLVWPGILILPNAIAATALVRAPEFPLLQAFVWLLMLGVGLSFLLPALADHCFGDAPLLGGTEALGERLQRQVPFTFAYVLFTVFPVSAIASSRSPVGPELLVLAGLLFGAPLHALFAPAHVAIAQGRSDPRNAVQIALQCCRKRTWMHVAVLVSVGVITALVMGWLWWFLVVALHTDGFLVSQFLRVLVMSVGESLFACTLTVCGLDAMALTLKRTREPSA
jgi:hypothetical protein